MNIPKKWSKWKYVGANGVGHLCTVEAVANLNGNYAKAGDPPPIVLFEDHAGDYQTMKLVDWHMCMSPIEDED